MAKTRKNTPPKTAQPTSPVAREREPVLIKKVNTRLLFITLAIFGVLAPSVYFVHAWQVEGNADRLKERAEAAEAEGQFIKAFQLYGQYLNFRQNDFDTKLYYLRWRDGWATSGNAYERVLLSYEELLRRDPNRADEAEIRQDVIAVAMRTGDYALAMHHLEVLLDKQKSPEFHEKNPDQVPELRFQLARSLDADGRTKDAYSNYRDLINDSPREPKYYIPLAYLFEDQWRNLPPRPEEKPETEQQEDTELKPGSEPAPDSSKPEAVATTLSEKIKQLLPEKNQRDFPGADAADQILEWMVDEADAPADAFLARAQYRQLRNRLLEAREDVESARKLDAENPMLLMVSAQLATSQAQEARQRADRAKYFPFLRLAREDAAGGRAQNPNDAQFPWLQSLIEEEAREGLGLIPRDEKQADAEQFPQKFKDARRQELWVAFQTSERILREGLDVAKNAYAEIDRQKPVRTSLRNQEKNPLPNRFQLSRIITQLRWSLADILISQHQLVASDPNSKANQQSSAESLKAEVNELIEQLKKARATGFAEFLAARMLMVEGDWNEAIWPLEQTRTRLFGQTEYIHRIDLLLDECYARLGNPDKRVELAERAFEETPNWKSAILRLPFLYQQANRPDDALKAYQRINGWPEGSLAIARLRVQKELSKPVQNRRWDAIHALLDSLESSSFEDPSSLPIFRANVYSWEAAQLLELGEKDNSKDKFKAAVDELEKALAAFPENGELRAARGLMEFQNPLLKGKTVAERTQAAAKKIEDAILEHGDQLPLRLAAAQIAAFLPPADALLKLSALENPPFPDDEQPKFLEGLARAHAIVGFQSKEQSDKDAATKRVMEYRKRAATLQSTNIASQIELGELAFGQKDSATIQTAIDRVTKVEGPEGPNGNFLTALKLILESRPIMEAKLVPDAVSSIKLSLEEEQTVEAIRQHLRRAMKERAFWPEPARTLGYVEAAIGNGTAALTHFQKAYELGDRSPEMITHMVTYYSRNQRAEDADAILRKVALDKPVLLSDDLGRMQSLLTFQLGRQDEAVGFANAQAAHSMDFRDHLMESKLRFAHGELGPQVLEPLKKARDLAKDQPDPWVELVRYYVRVGNTKQAEATIEEAKQHIAHDPPHRLPLALAQCYDILNDRKTAEQHYLTALKSVPAKSAGWVSIQKVVAEFYGRSPNANPEQRKADVGKAFQIFDQILDSMTDVTVENRDWARHGKARLMASSMRYEDMQKALEFLAKSRRGKDATVADLRVEMQILSARNRHQDRLALIKILQTLQEKNDVKPEEKLALARAYEQTDQWPKAQPIYEELVDASPDDAALLARYTYSLIARAEADEAQHKSVEALQKLNEAQSLLAKVKRVQKDSFGVILLEAAFLHAKKDVSAAVRLIQEGIEGLEDVDSPEQAVSDLVIAGKLAEAVDSLETDAREKNDTKTMSALGEVRQLLTAGNPDQAAERLKRLILASSLQFGLQIYELKGAARILDGWGELSGAESIIRRMLEKSKRPEDALMLISNIARQGRVDEALALCQKAWDTSPAESVGGICVGIIRAGKPSASQIAVAESQLKVAIEKNPDSLGLQITLADLRDFQGRYDEAEQIYGKILMKNPNHITALNNLAWLVAMRGHNPALAVQCINQAIDLAEKAVGPVPELLDTRAVVYLKIGNNKAALSDMRKAVDVAAETPPMTYFHLAQAYLANGMTSDAKRTFEKAKSLTADDFYPLERETYEKIAKSLGGS